MTAPKKPGHDYTATKRSVARLQRAAHTIPPITLDARHAEALQWIVRDTGESVSACVRRLIKEDAARRDAPIE